MKFIEILVRGKGKARAELDGRNPAIAKRLLEILPLEAGANLWGEEVYFDVPLQLDDEDPSPSAREGDVSYWSPGPALCIFFGKTQPYSPVNHLGRIVEGMDIFRDVEEGDRIVLNRI